MTPLKNAALLKHNVPNAVMYAVTKQVVYRDKMANPPPPAQWEMKTAYACVSPDTALP